MEQQLGTGEKVWWPQVIFNWKAKDMVSMKSLKELGDIIYLRVVTELKDKVETSLHTMVGDFIAYNGGKSKPWNHIVKSKD